MHASPIECLHRLGKIVIDQWHALSSKDCALHASDISQQQETSAKVCMHLTWYVCDVSWFHDTFSAFYSNFNMFFVFVL